MQPITRHLATALVVLIVFVAAALTGQAWLQRETRHLRAATVGARRAQLEQALAMTHRTADTWDDAFQADLGKLLGGTVTLVSRPPAAEPGAAVSGQWVFEAALPGRTDAAIRVAFAVPATARLAAVSERLLLAVSLLAVLLLMISMVFALPRRAPGAGAGSREPWPAARTEMQGLEHFARLSVERTEALARESGARVRAEEDLQLQRTLLGQSREEREQLGRELHDNICQTLYAVSLTLEGVRKKLGGAGETEQRLDQCVAELRRLNREVRAYLQDLEPGGGPHGPFGEALEAMLATQATAGGVRLVRNLDPEVTALIAPEQATDAVNIVREAVSNSLRHGQARTITVRAARGENSVVVAVQDDGTGFDPAEPRGGGHGLVNMQARARALGGFVEVTSAPGKGTRVLLTLPVGSAP